MVHADTDPVTWKELRLLLKRLKKLDERIDDCFDEFHTADDALGELYDKHEEQIARLRRAQNRLRRQIEEFE